MDSLPTPLLPPVVVKATLMMREDITPSASGWKYAEYRMSKNQMKEKVGASKIIGLIHDRPVYVLCKNYERQRVENDLKRLHQNSVQIESDFKREIDITLPSARSHAEDQLKNKCKQKHDETVADFGLAVRFRNGAVREFKNRGGEMTNYKYAELFAANVHERHQRIALELVTDLDPDNDDAIVIFSSA